MRSKSLSSEDEDEEDDELEPSSFSAQKNMLHVLQKYAPNSCSIPAVNGRVDCFFFKALGAAGCCEDDGVCEDPAKQKEAYQQIIDKELSVREVEDVVRGLKNHVKKTPPASAMPLSFELQKMNEALSTILDAKVKLKATRAGNGTITIQFNSERELRNIISKIES